MGEILSNAEVEAILSAVSPPRPDAPPVSEPISPADNPAWESHDFRRPQPIRGAALKLVQSIHRGIARCAADRLTTLLQTRVEIRLAGACKTTSAEFFATLHPAWVACQFGSPAADAPALIAWSRTLLQSLFSSMLGGRVHGSDAGATHLMTAIEQRLLTKLNEPLVSELSETLHQRFATEDVYEDHPPVADERWSIPMTWLSFEIHCDGTKGLVHVGVLPTDMTDASTRNQTTVASLPVPPGMQKVTVEVTAELARLRLRVSDVATLQVGDVLVTDLHPATPITLSLGEQTLCNAAIGTHMGYKAVRLIESPERSHE